MERRIYHTCYSKRPTELSKCWNLFDEAKDIPPHRLLFGIMLAKGFPNKNWVNARPEETKVNWFKLEYEMHEVNEH